MEITLIFQRNPLDVKKSWVEDMTIVKNTYHITLELQKTPKVFRQLFSPSEKISIVSLDGNLFYVNPEKETDEEILTKFFNSLERYRT